MIKERNFIEDTLETRFELEIDSKRYLEIAVKSVTLSFSLRKVKKGNRI